MTEARETLLERIAALQHNECLEDYRSRAEAMCEHCETVNKVGEIVRAHLLAAPESTPPEPDPKFPMDGIWRCSGCGEMKQLLDPAWRWAFDHWQHRCPGLHPQVGHERARYFGPTPRPEEESTPAPREPLRDDCTCGHSILYHRGGGPCEMRCECSAFVRREGERVPESSATKLPCGCANHGSSGECWASAGLIQHEFKARVYLGRKRDACAYYFPAGNKGRLGGKRCGQPRERHLRTEVEKGK